MTKIKKILISLIVPLMIITFVLIQPQEVKPVYIDYRVVAIDNYFKEHNMPLYGYASTMVEVSDRYGLDWRLLAAISIRETSGGLYMCKNPKAQNNPFGWGSCKIGFKSINEAIEVVGYKLSNLPVYKGKTTEKILYYYNGTVVKSYPSEVINIMNSIGSN